MRHTACRAPAKVEVLVRAAAAGRGITVARAAIAWALSRGRGIVPRPGACLRDRLDKSLVVLDVQLNAADLAEKGRRSRPPPRAIPGRPA